MEVEKVVLLCDICGAEGAEGVTVEDGPGRWFKIDLCPQCRSIKTLAEILAHARAATPKVVPKGPERMSFDQALRVADAVKKD